MFNIMSVHSINQAAKRVLKVIFEDSAYFKGVNLVEILKVSAGIITYHI